MRQQKANIPNRPCYPGKGWGCRIREQGTAWEDPAAGGILIVDKLIDRIGSAFRGLWKSVLLLETGKQVVWSVTFLLDGEFVETPYCPTPIEALQEALDSLNG